MKVHIFSSINWHFYWQQPHEIARACSEKYHVNFINPIKIETPKSAHTQHITPNPVPKNITIIKNKIAKKNGTALAYLLQEFLNLKYAIKTTNKSDILIFYNPIGQSIAFCYAALRRRKIIFMNVDDYNSLTYSLLSKLVVRLAIPYWLKNSKSVFCTSKKILEYSKKYNSNSEYLPNGVYLDKHNNKHRILDNDKFTIGYVGSLDNHIRIKDFIRLAREFSDAEVRIIGGGEQLESLKEAKKKLSLSNLDLVGPVAKNKVFRHLRHFDIALIPYKINDRTNAASSVKLFEYWAKKKCVVSTKTYELKQYKKALVFYSNQKDLVMKIRELKRNPRKIAKQGEIGLAFVETKNNWAGNLKEKVLRSMQEL